VKAKTGKWASPNPARSRQCPFEETRWHLILGSHSGYSRDVFDEIHPDKVA
jgi:hypothetical protein